MISRKTISKVRALKTFGESMRPLLLDGDVVYLRQKKFSRIAVDDIVCIQKNRRVFTHRVVYVAKNYLITKGDNNSFSDGKIYPKNVLGVVYKVKRGKGFLQLESIYLMQSTLYFAEIVRVKKALDKAGVESVILKGLPLYLNLEKTYPKRIYADCDILIGRKDLKRASGVFAKLGYLQSDSSLSKIQSKLKKEEEEKSFVKIIGGFAVIFDLHLEVVFMMTQLGELNSLYPKRLIHKLSEKFMREKTGICVEGYDFHILSTSNLLVYLALHLFHHNFKEGYRFEFIKRLILANKVDYSEIKNTILSYRLQNFVYPCFALLKNYYFVEIPEEFMEDIKPKKAVLKFIKGGILNTKIFDGEERVDSGVKRFRNLFYLSPNNMFVKLSVFLDVAVIYSVLWVFFRNLRGSLKTGSI